MFNNLAVNNSVKIHSSKNYCLACRFYTNPFRKTFGQAIYSLLYSSSYPFVAERSNCPFEQIVSSVFWFNVLTRWPTVSLPNLKILGKQESARQSEK